MQAGPAKNKSLVAVSWLLVYMTCGAGPVTLLLGCAWSEPVDSQVEKAVLSLELNKSGARVTTTYRGKSRLSELIREHGAVALLASLRRLYPQCDNPKDKMRVVVASERVAGSVRSASSKEWLRQLGSRLLEEASADLVAKALQVLEHLDKEVMPDRVRERLGTAQDARVRGHLLHWLVSEGIFEPIKNELSLPRPEGAGGKALDAWRDRIRLCLAVCERATSGQSALPAPVLDQMLAPAVVDGELVYPIIHTLVDAAEPEDVKAALVKARSSVRAGSPAQIWVSAALLATTGEGAPDQLAALGQAAERYRTGEECWPELTSRTAALAFAAAQRRDETWLTAMWDACTDLRTRDRAELLWLIARECLSDGGNEFLLMARRIPVDDLAGMVGMVHGRLAAHLDAFVYLSDRPPLSDSVSREEMDAAIQHVSRALSRAANDPYSASMTPVTPFY